MNDSRGNTVSLADKPRRKRVRVSTVLLIITALLFTAPVVMTFVKNAHQASIAQSYSRKLQAMAPQRKSELLAAAQAYNQHLSLAPLRDPWGSSPDKDSAEYREYLAMLSIAAGVPMSRVIIPTINVDLPVYHGTGEDTLYQGVGHLFGSALPVGGEGTHSVLTGHTGISSATLFDNLAKVEVGERIYLDTAGEHLAYEVEEINTVLPTDVSRIQPEPGRDLITLITCTPYGINSHRLLVKAHRVQLTDDSPFDQQFKQPWQMWMSIFLLFAAVALLVLLLPPRKRRENREHSKSKQEGSKEDRNEA